MLKNRVEKGFTLVELAIVLVIVGLLIGGILKGQQLMENASITATVSQIRAIEAATTNFMDTYGALPGDLLDADSKITDCTGTLCVNAGAETAGSERFNPGDGIVGNTDWNMSTYQPGATLNSSTAIVTGTDANLGTTGVRYGMETLLFWHSLQQAGLINAVTDPMGNGTGTGQTFGRTIPQAEIAGGFWAGYTSSSSGAAAIPLPDNNGTTSTPYTLLGTVISLVGEPSDNIDASLSDSHAVIPVVAATIDRKIDDGLPSSGYVQALGNDEQGANDSCISGTGSSMLYNESNEQLDCGVHIVIVPQS